MRPPTLLAVVALLPASLLVTGPGPAAPIRCDLPGGRVLYQDPPCPAGASGREIDGTVALAVEPPPAPAPGPTPAAGRERRSRAKERDKSRATPAQRESSEPSRASSRPREPREKTRRNQALAPERRFLRAGMTEAEVLASVGEPDMVSRAPRGVGRSARRSDTWVYGPAPWDPQTTTTLVFRDGAVAEVRRIVGR